MSFDSIVRSGVALANQLTTSLQVPVIHRAWIGDDNYGEPDYAAPSTAADGGVLKGAVEMRQVMHTRPDGTSVMTKVKITFVQPVPPNGNPNRTAEPIDTRDYIELPNGVTGPIIDVQGVLDPGTSEPYATDVWLGTN